MNLAKKFRSRLLLSKFIFALTAAVVMGGFFMFAGTALASDLSVSCSGTVLLGTNQITWSAIATGGNEPYSFVWDSSDDNSAADVITNTYIDYGKHVEHVQVTDSSLAVATSSCSAYIGTLTLIDYPEIGSFAPDLGTQPFGISGNNIVGTYSGDSQLNGFLYDGTTWISLNPSGNRGASGNGFLGNNSIVGTLSSSLGYQGFVYNGISWTTLVCPGDNAQHYSTQAFGAFGNNIVGSCSNSGFLYDGASWTKFNVPWEANGTEARGISGNNIIGNYFVTGSDYPYNFTHGFLFDGISWAMKDAPGAYKTFLRGISGNNIVGYYYAGSGYNSSGPHGFIYDGTSWATMDMPGTMVAFADGISGDKIVGRYYDYGLNEMRGFLYTIPGLALIPVTSITVTGADSANSVISGQILQMNVTESPDNVSNQSVKWSVINGTGSAMINSMGLLTAVNAGTVTVKATADDGFGVTGSEQITIISDGTTPIFQLSNLGQSKMDGTTHINEGSSTPENTVIFQGTLINPNSNPVRLQVEVEPSGTAFTGTPTATGIFSSTWGTISVFVPNLASGQYHWQARTIDSQNNVSVWQTMSEPAASTDFVITRYPVIIIPGIIGSQEVLGKWETDPILHTYDNLRGALKLAGYQENKTLFTFPYDWRQSNASSSLLLKQRIDQAKADCSMADPVGYDCGKVDLVAHSMGGLVARAYAESDNYQNDIDQLIFLATPHKGSPKSYLEWEGGESGKDWRSRIYDSLFDVYAGYESAKYKNVFEFIRNFPVKSVQELLPVYDYLQDNVPSAFRIYPANYPVNNFLEDLNAPAKLNKLSGIKITNILADAGNGSTLNSLHTVDKSFSDGRWENGYPENYDGLFGDHGLIMGEGDDTVPKISNSNFLGQPDIIIANSSHMDIPTDAQKEVIRELTGVLPQKEVRSHLVFSAIMNTIIFVIYSPADFIITSPDGRQLGKDFVNNTEINQIPNAYYSGFTDEPEFVVIPNPIDGQYKVELQGKNGGGNYHVQASYIGESTTTQKDFSATIGQGQEQTFNLDCASNSPQSIINLTPQDTIPPIIVVNSPTSGAKYFHSDKLKINYTATDDFSGVASVTVAIDNNILSTTTIDLFNYTLGVHGISIKAVDKAGNQTIKTVNFVIIANIDSTIYDIKTAYSKKWLIKEADKNVMVLSLESLRLGLDLLASEKIALNKLINDAQNNPKLTAAAKKKIIDPLNKLLDANSEARQSAISCGLSGIQKILDVIKQKKGINQLGYDIIKADIDYLKINL